MIKKIITSVLFVSLYSCNINNNPILEQNQTNIFSIEDNNKSEIIKQAEEIINLYPESAEYFYNWKPSDNESLELKKSIANKISNKNILSQEKINKILTQGKINNEISLNKFKPISFDEDQGEHKSKFTEWWYYNGHLNTDDGKKYGYELCFFRVATFIYFAHIAITDENNQKFYYERKFYSPKIVKTDNKKANVIFDKNGMIQTDKFSYKIFGEVKGFQFNLNLKMNKEPLLINGNGLIDMPEGKDSYYYSLTKLETTGFLIENGVRKNVKGQSWFDHQWGNFYVMRVGWDWFSFQMEDNTEYNLFSFRNKKDQTLKQYVNVLNSNNKSDHSVGFNIQRLDWWTSPFTNDLYVTKWKIDIPQRKETFIVTAVHPGQEVFPIKKYDIAPSYWEGKCYVEKQDENGKITKGLSYVEHFKYLKQIP
ncbi:MAG: hypothetical protein KatS3mg068_1949 [Candidatus Sericytochromatia bacterium]|nr:MAG: hypothetical protein KatS3mg068_1949 [Candidatus Sericytochromatia bacterium]